MHCRLSSDQFFVDKLTPQHADFISEYWTYFNNDSKVIKRYFRHILTVYDISTGIFAKSDPSYPVSWVLYCDYGNAMCLRTLPEYQRMGFGIVAVSNICTQLEHKGIIPVGEQIRENITTGKFGNYVTDTVWRDSITGECYLQRYNGKC